jgi:hypothetical protein
VPTPTDYETPTRIPTNTRMPTNTPTDTSTPTNMPTPTETFTETPTQVPAASTWTPYVPTPSELRSFKRAIPTGTRTPFVAPTRVQPPATHATATLKPLALAQPPKLRAQTAMTPRRSFACSVLRTSETQRLTTIHDPHS